MIDVFSARSLIYWWGMLTATLFVKEWLDALAHLFTDSVTFTPDKIPFNLVPGMNKGIDDLTEFIKTSINFNPDQVIATVGPLSFYGWGLALLLGIIILAAGIAMYVRALKTEAWYDDFLTLIFLYFILRIEGHIVGSTQLHLLDSFKAFVDNPTVTFAVLMILMLFLSFFGEGWNSKRAFWRALLEALFFALLIYPVVTANWIGAALHGLALFGGSLVPGVNVPFAMGWGLFGMALAIYRLMAQESPAGRGGGGEGGGRGGGGGLLSRLRKPKSAMRE